MITVLALITNRYVSNSLLKFNSHDSAVALSKYLGSRFHPELPHIGTVGTADTEESTEKDYEEEEGELQKDETVKKPSASTPSSAEKRFSSFKFVPSTATYGMDLTGQKKKSCYNIFVLHKDR